jgi:hypothetical protein
MLMIVMVATACGGSTDPDLSDDGAGSVPTEASYDFAVDFVSIVGNIDAVAGCDSPEFDFVDDFGDGLASSGCTAELNQVLGTFAESSGFLQMPGPDAGIPQEGGYLGHVVQFDQILVDGLGDAEFVASFRADIPSNAPGPSLYGIKIVDDRLGPFLQAVIIQIQPDDTGQTVIRAYRSHPTDIGVSIETPIDLASVSRIDLKLEFLDAADLVLPFYSVDGGMTYKRILNPNGSNFSMPAWDVEGGRPSGATAIFELIGIELVG